MIKLTLLELVQDMLVAIDSEGVASVGDTEEAGMCVNIANRAFEKMAVAKRWSHFRTYGTLDTSATLNQMTLPSGAFAFDRNNVYYASNRVYYMRPAEFLRETIGRSTAESNIAAYNSINIYTDRNPLYFTSDDDETLRFDAIPNTISGLTSANTMAIYWKYPTSRKAVDADVFDMPAQAFPALGLICCGMAVKELKDDDQKATMYMREYRQELSRLSKSARLIDPDPDVRESIVPRRSMSQPATPIYRTN
jgi:hypothetical protein